jgi:UTP--glucose-1-phosphate uridylyltransferase
MGKMIMHDVKKAVIPVAGLGTRFLPVTKSMPKEMLPIVDKPVVHYVVEEAIASGIDDILFITGRGKRSIEDYFDDSPELEMHLEAHHKEDQLRMVRDISSMIDIHYVRQKEPKGLGDAILTARKHVDGEPFAVLLGDDIVINDKPCTMQLIEIFRKYGRSTIAVEEVPPEKSSSYGMIKGNPIEDCLYAIEDIIEKPQPGHSPSNIGTIGRYIFTPEIFDCLGRTTKGVSNEIQLTDAIASLNRKQKTYAYKFQGTRYDTGDKLGYVKAIVDFAMRNEDIREQILEHMGELLYAGSVGESGSEEEVSEGTTNWLSISV